MKNTGTITTDTNHTREPIRQQHAQGAPSFTDANYKSASALLRDRFGLGR